MKHTKHTILLTLALALALALTLTAQSQPTPTPTTPTPLPTSMVITLTVTGTDLAQHPATRTTTITLGPDAVETLRNFLDYQQFRGDGSSADLGSAFHIHLSSLIAQLMAQPRFTPSALQPLHKALGNADIALRAEIEQKATLPLKKETK